MSAQTTPVSASTSRGEDEGRRFERSNRVKAMSHPLRARIFHLLADRGPSSPVQLSRVLEAEEGRTFTIEERKKLLHDVSYHCKQLCKFDCAEPAGTRPVRGANEHFYRATDRPLIDMSEWEQLDLDTAHGLLCGYIQEILDDFVASREARMVGFDSEFHITRSPFMLDATGLSEGMQVQENARLEMIEVARRSAERQAESGHPATPVSASIVFFKIPRDRIDGPKGAAPGAGGKPVPGPA